METQACDFDSSQASKDRSNWPFTLARVNCTLTIVALVPRQVTRSLTPRRVAHLCSLLAFVLVNVCPGAMVTLCNRTVWVEMPPSGIS